MDEFVNKSGRKSIRLPEFDYTTPGSYFVTICTRNSRCLFGRISQGKMSLNQAGTIAKQCWETIPAHFQHVELDVSIVMPDHLHGIINILEDCRDTACRVPTTHEAVGNPVRGSLPTIIRSFKSASTRQINFLTGNTGERIWQSRFYDHVIRRTRNINAVREYILNNPLRWELEKQNG